MSSACFANPDGFELAGRVESSRLFRLERTPSRLDIERPRRCARLQEIAADRGATEHARLGGPPRRTLPERGRLATRDVGEPVRPGRRQPRCLAIESRCDAVVGPVAHVLPSRRRDRDRPLDLTLLGTNRLADRLPIVVGRSAADLSRTPRERRRGHRCKPDQKRNHPLRTHGNPGRASGRLVPDASPPVAPDTRRIQSRGGLRSWEPDSRGQEDNRPTCREITSRVSGSSKDHLSITRREAWIRSDFD